MKETAFSSLLPWYKINGSWELVEIVDYRSEDEIVRVVIKTSEGTQLVLLDDIYLSKKQPKEA